MPDVLFVGILLVTVLLMGERMLVDADSGWHLRTGEWILANRSFVHHDIFSYTKHGASWVAWEWLYDVLLAVAHRIGGLNGVVMLSGLVLAATFRKLLVTLLARKSNLYASLIVTLLAFGAVAIHTHARPHLVSWFFTLTLYVWFDDFQRGTRTAKQLLISAPLLMALWVNLHGGFVVGLAVAGMFVVANAWDGAKAKLRVTASAVALLFLASLCSPYSYRLHLAVLDFLVNPTLMDTIEEFRSPNFHLTTAKFSIVMVALCVVAPSYSRLRYATHEALVLALSIYVALVAARGIPSSVLLMAVIVTPHVSAVLNRSRALRARSRVQLFLNARRRSPLVRLVVIAALATVVAKGTIQEAQFPADRFPIAGARDFLAEHPEIDHVLSPDFYAGYLTYHRPGLQLAMDSRFDFLGEAYAKDFETVARAHPGWKQIVERWNVRYVLFPAKSTLASTLKESPEWTVRFQDAGSVVFERAAPTHLAQR